MPSPRDFPAGRRVAGERGTGSDLLRRSSGSEEAAGTERMEGGSGATRELTCRSLASRRGRAVVSHSRHRAAPQRCRLSRGFCCHRRQPRRANCQLESFAFILRLTP